MGRQAARTIGSSAALRLISGPMPAGSPVAIAMIGLSKAMAYSMVRNQWRQRRIEDHGRIEQAIDQD
jgi:hypothetical protein